MITTKVVIPAFIDKKEITGSAPHIVKTAVSPQVAEEWLIKNKNNRSLNKSHVGFLAHQMADGKWSELNGDTIRFDIEGNLLDGQHRLSALIESGKTLLFMVVIGLPTEYFKTMDTGKKRNGADVLGIEGYKYATIAASLCKFMIKWDNSSQSGAINRGAGKSFGRTRKVTNEQISDFARKNKAKLISYTDTASHYSNIGDRLVSPTWLAALLWLFSEKNIKEAESFVYKLSTGANVGYKSLMFQLRKKLIESKSSPTKRLTPMAQFAYIIKVWNANRTGKQLKVLSYNPASGERFPAIV